MARFPYTFFDNYVVRVPLFPYKEFQEVFSENTNNERLNEIFSDNLFKESIYLASSELYREMERFKEDGPDNNENSKRRLRNTILKYYNRMSTRCTPFGLFASAGVGHFDVSTSFPKLFLEWQKLRETKVDMNFLVSLSQHLLSIANIRNKLLFFPNNSIYKVGNKIRYIEHETIGFKRDYFISSAPISKELEKIIDSAKEGKTILQLTDLIKNNETSFKEEMEYIDELIENRVLVSELEPNVSCADYLDAIIIILNRIEAHREKSILLTLQDKIKKLDNNFSNSITIYKEIEKLVNTLTVKYEQKYLFQTDLYCDNNVKLSYHWKKELKKGISFLNKLTATNSANTLLEKFKTSFYERFENEEIPLAFALDNDLGINYRQDIQEKGIHPYLEDLDLPLSKEKQNLEIKLKTLQIILNKKIQEVLLLKKYSIVLCDEDLPGFEENWNDLSDTMYFMAEIVSESNQEKLYLNFGSANAGKLMARFCSEKSAINDLVKEITQKEKQCKPKNILAEIVHLPEARTGNILRRSKIKEYEIPYLAKSLLPDKNQITVDDLYLSVQNNRLVLHSKLHNKEVVPYLTNAHNYANNSLPLYHFLCDMETQNLRSELYFDWGSLSTIYNFLPRVEYENIIFSKARWKVSSEEIKRFLSLLKTLNRKLVISEVEEWRKIRQIPQWIQWLKYDNSLVFNLSNWDLLTLFFSSVKNENEIFIEEFLFNEKENFTSQFIFPLYKDSR